VDVLTNTHPDFVTTVQTQWNLISPNGTHTGSVVNYTLPELVDPQGNDEPEFYITTAPGKSYPD